EIYQDAVLAQVKNVLKLGTVEGYFNDIYSYKEYYGFDISPFQKKALIRVKAKVLIGVDLEKVKIDINDSKRSVVVSNITKPGILSLDHDLDYYDITEGTFNSFSVEDYNKMNKQAKIFIRQKAWESDLFRKSQEQFEQHIELLDKILKSYGWVLTIKYKYQKLPYLDFGC
ncbi:MAG TPA: DUF4230 domain-containing protein, partial [Bacteroidetes bacterium]|nr:DUF4230 domain-containing protein [Bacteroidota bacterium]